MLNISMNKDTNPEQRHSYINKALYGHSTQMLTWKIVILMWLQTVNYIPKLSSLLAAIRAKLLGPEGGLHVSKKAIPNEQAPW